MGDEITAITQLLYRYCHLADRRDIEGILELFHPDSTLVVQASGDDDVRKGVEAVRAWYRSSAESRVAGTVARHHITCPLVEVEADRATARSYVRTEGVRSDGSVHVLVGRYEDDLVRGSSGSWRFLRRSIIVDARIPAAGPAVIVRPPAAAPA